MQLAFSKCRFIRTNQFIVLPGGVFLIQTALMEIFHMLVPHDLQGEQDGNLVMRVAFCTLMWVLIMGVEFSLDTV
jgi:hypothetical protein